MKEVTATSMALTLTLRLAAVSTALALGLAGMAHAQTVYRCGADGRSFSQVPCEGGDALPRADSPSAERRAEAQKTAEREAALARRMTQDREAQEAALRPAAAVGIRSTVLRSGLDRTKRPHARTVERSSRKPAGKLGRREAEPPH